MIYFVARDFNPLKHKENRQRFEELPDVTTRVILPSRMTKMRKPYIKNQPQIKGLKRLKKSAKSAKSA